MPTEESALATPNPVRAPVRAPQRIGRYRLVDVVGRGAVGTVYRAVDTSIEREVALKTVLRPDETSTPSENEAYARFIREARAAGKLSHPNLVTVYDVGVDERAQVSFIAMEFVEGKTLDRVVDERCELGYDEIRKIGMQVADALAHAHASGVVHRDVKPANLILTRAGAVKLADFGIAKIDSATMTTDGTLLGSPGYMSPEQVRARAVDHRSDLFSLGTVLYELCALESAFPGDTMIEVIQRVVKGKTRPLRKIRPDIPPDLERTIAKAMARRPEHRFASAATLRDALRPPAPPRAQPGEKARRLSAVDGRTGPAWRRSLPLVAAISCGVLSLLGAYGGMSLGEPLAPPAFSLPAGLPSVEPQPEAALASARWSAELPAASRPVRKVAPPPPGPEEKAEIVSEPAIVEPQPAVPAPTPEPVIELSFPFVFAVVHDHRLGSCRGRLQVFADRISYDSHDREVDDRHWAMAELEGYGVEGDELTLVADERDGGSLGLRSKRYRFTVRGGLPDELVEHLRGVLVERQ